jgi:flavin reductase (DIM6/NTAB) family NADH-FMN oxidoreductase RutF
MKKKVEIKPFWYSDVLVVPMLVTIITTINKDGVINAAPYSLVMPYDVSRKNPQILIGLRKQSHTYKNIMETKEFVVNLPTASYLEEIMEMCKLYPEGVNELENTTLTSIDSLEVRPPSITECPQHIECTLSHNLETDRVQAVIVGDIVAIVVNEDLLDVDRGTRIEHLNLPIYMGDEKKRYFYYGSVRKTSMLKLGDLPSIKEGPKVITHLPWEEAVLKKMKELPSAIRQIVVDMVEEEAQKEGVDVVTHEYSIKMLEDYAPPSVLERFKKEKELKVATSI